LSSPEGRRSPMVRAGVKLANADTLDYENHHVSADVARGYRKGPEGRWEPKGRPDSGYAGASERDSVDSGGIADAIRTMLESAVVDELEIVEGEYYCAPAMPRDTPCFSAMFPDGHDSVVRFLVHDATRGLQHGMTAANRWVAVQALLRRFNALSCELNGALNASRDVGVLSKGRDSVAVRDWVSNFMSRMGEVQAEIRNLVDCLGRVSKRFCQLDTIPREIMAVHERSFTDYIVAGIRRLPEKPTRLDDVHSVFRQALVADVGDAGESLGRLRISHDVGHVYGGKTAAPLDSAKMPRVGRGMRAIRVEDKVRSSSNALRIGKWIAGT